MSSNNARSVKRTSLFPSAEWNSTEASSTKNFDWLENKSFTSETAEKVVQFQKELGVLQNKSNTDESDDINEVGIGKPRGLTGDSEIKRTAIDLTQSDDRDVKDTHRRREHSSDADPEEYTYKRKKKQKYVSSDDEDRTDRKKKKSKHKHKKKHKKEKNKHTKKKETEILGMFESKKIFFDDIEDIAPQHAFKLDRTPDNNSWVYGSLYNGHIAHYKAACNTCIGSARNQPLYLKDRDKGNKDRIAYSRYHSKENRRLVKQEADEIIKVSPGESNKDIIIDSYIPVQDAKADLLHTDIRQTILDDSTSLYVIGKGKETEAVETDVIKPDPVRLKVASYNKRLRDTPNDVKLWLEYVTFQDKLVLIEREHAAVTDIEDGYKNSSARGILEKKLSILDKALESNPANIELLLAQIQLKSDISDTSTINKELEDLLFIHAANTRLWKFYLMFNQSRISVFTVTKMTKHYHKCLRTLFSILDGDVQTHHVPENLESEILDIVLQYCIFLRQSGYKEKAMATFQALLEYNLFPPSPEMSKKNKMAEFEVFWDSNCPRIGTAEALGWKNFFERNFIGSGKDNPDSLENLEDAIVEKTLSQQETWLQIESLRDQHTWLPWQPGEGQTEDDCVDVERLVVFDDISQVLFNVSNKLKVKLVQSFLKFLGFPQTSGFCRQQSSLCSENVSDLLSFYQGSVMEDVAVCGKNEVVRNVAVEVLRLVVPCFSGKERSDLTIDQIQIQLGKYQSDHLSKSDKKEMRKIVKNVLKEESNRKDLFVWSAYIDLERSIGKPDEGKSVIETALAMYSGESVEDTNEKTVGLISLYCQFCEILLNINQQVPYKLLPRTSQVQPGVKRKVLSVVNCLTDGKRFVLNELSDISGALILKTLSSLVRLRTCLCEIVCTRGCSVLSKEKFLKLVWCESIFAYCKSGLKSSQDIYTSLLLSVSLGADNDTYISDIEKRLHSDQLRLIVYHMSTTTTPLQVLRESLDAALHRFPDDPVFLSLFTDVERKSRISGRFNSFFDRWCRTVESPVPTVIALLTQLDFISDLKNSEYLDTSPSGIVHRTRAWLEQSLQHGSLQHCPLLWRLYFLIEKQVGSSGRLKGLFYRAVQQCPWNKSIFMDGVRMFDTEQLQEVVDLMTEKELRVHIPVEELDILTT